MEPETLQTYYQTEFFTLHEAESKLYCSHDKLALVRCPGNFRNRKVEIGSKAKKRLDLQ